MKAFWLVPLALAGTVGCDDFNALGSCQDSGRCLSGDGGGASDSGLTCAQDFYLQDAGEIPSAVWIGSANDVWVGTQSNAIYHRQPNGSWTRELGPSGVPGPNNGEAAFWGTAVTPILAGGWNGTLETYDGGQWPGYAPQGTGHNNFAFYATPGGRLWVAAQGSIYTATGDWTDGTNWGSLVIPSTTAWQGVWGVADDVWMVGLDTDGGNSPRVKHVSDGGTSDPVPQSAGELESIWGDSSGYFAVGGDDVSPTGSAVFCRLNTDWSCSTDGSLGTHAHGLWGRNSSDVWATADGNILHFDGNTWSIVGQFLNPGGGPATFYRMWGNAQQVWAAGDDALVHCP